MKKLFGCLTMVVICIAVGSAQAQGPWVLYDDFNGQFIDIENWGTSQRIDAGVTILEYVRKLHGGRLHMEDRAFGYTPESDPYSGQRAGDINSVFGLGKVYKRMKVSIKVKKADVTGCSENLTPSSSRARLIGFFFNSAGPPYNGRLNDVVAQVRIQKTSDSAQGERALEAWAEVLSCTNSACTTASGPPPVFLGTVRLGQWAIVEIDWNVDSSEFNFALNGNSQPIYYGDQGWGLFPLSSPWNGIGVSNRLANCPVEKRAWGHVEAEFENLFVGEFSE